jgi:hypothetical protein
MLLSLGFEEQLAAFQSRGRHPRYVSQAMPNAAAALELRRRTSFSFICREDQYVHVMPSFARCFWPTSAAFTQVYSAVTAIMTAPVARGGISSSS